MQYGLMTYPSFGGVYNIGDYIQSLAALQFLPQVDCFINREALHHFKDDPVKMIMNGWFMHIPENWPPSSAIDPLFVSFHINAGTNGRLLTSSGVDYFKKWASVGCRDLYTLKLLKDAGVHAYFSGCLTTTLDLDYTADSRSDNVYIVDAQFDVQTLGVFLDRDLLATAEFVTHLYGDEEPEIKRFERAAELIGKYARAKLVITSRLHCALPCLALGTPVLFLQSGSEDETCFCRFEGLLELLNTISIDSAGGVTSNFGVSHGDKIGQNCWCANSTKYLERAEFLKSECIRFIGQV
ncbi:polysaccharide pyruvyl transferase family protein [Dinghuibacter silviterrae]|uniref:Polysaccharide pyruvyl transferase n=1 Tax=Dinghuibacter silviterrae TaxID=1539049 RepID=A0A4R8DRX9_9BACT|nr:polysaccharide pyruvyl transferase family protein [Dinghuibacter silviterrae]TDX00980.1 polysaccharide pyruvyl transferase [Dinghuibacter silviterrae]